MSESPTNPHTEISSSDSTRNRILDKFVSPHEQSVGQDISVSSNPVSGTISPEQQTQEAIIEELSSLDEDKSQYSYNEESMDYTSDASLEAQRNILRAFQS